MADPTCNSKEFWILWISKIIRCFASMKFIWLMLLYIPIIYGMYEGQWIAGGWVAKIPPSVGCTLLGGGFVTLALGRIYAKTKLRENGSSANKNPMDDD